VVNPSEPNGVQRDRERVLRHLGDFRVSTAQIIARTCLGGRSLSATDSFLRRMMSPALKPALIATQPLYGRRRGYRLTRAGAKQIGLPPEAARPLGPQARVTRLAVLLFITAPDANRRLVPAPLLRDAFPIGAHRLPSRQFYLDESRDDPRLGFLVVDHGANVRRVVRKTAQATARFLKHGWFDAVVARRGLVVTVLTPTPTKQAAIRLQLEPYVDTVLHKPLQRFAAGGVAPIRFEVRVVAEIQPLVLAFWRGADGRRRDPDGTGTDQGGVDR